MKLASLLPLPALGLLGLLAGFTGSPLTEPPPPCPPGGGPDLCYDAPPTAWSCRQMSKCCLLSGPGWEACYLNVVANECTCATVDPD